MRMDKNDRYQYLRDRKRCGCCGKQDARTLEGYASGAVSMPPIHTAADVQRTVGVPDKTKKHAADEVSDYVLPKGIYGKPVLIL